MEKRERLFWNVVKGTAIFLMLWGHCIQYCTLGDFDFFENSVFKVIYTFHMPVLMMVSGYLFFYSFQKRSLKELLIHKIQGMLHPIVGATILGNILQLVPQYFLSDRFQIFYGVLFEGIDYAFWFLWAVLNASLIVGVICKTVTNPVLQLILTAAGMILVLLFPQWEMGLFMYPFFVAGFFAGMYRKTAAKLFRYLKYAAMLIFPLMVCFYETKHYIYITPVHIVGAPWNANLGLNLFRYAIGFAGSIGLMGIVDLVFRVTADKGRIPHIMQGICWLGKNSLAVYCLSVPLLSGYLPAVYTKLMSYVGFNLFAKSMTVYNYLFTPLLTAAFSAGIWLVIRWMQKTGIHKLVFGR